MNSVQNTQSHALAFIFIQLNFFDSKMLRNFRFFLFLGILVKTQMEKNFKIFLKIHS